MSGREIIRDELLSRDVFTLAGADRYATAIVTALTAAGYHIIGPGDLDPVTVERCAAQAEPIMLAVVNEWHRKVGIDDVLKSKLTRRIADTVATGVFATALRSLTEAKP